MVIVYISLIKGFLSKLLLIAQYTAEDLRIGLQLEKSCDGSNPT
jgi:hypothetical protein